MTGMCVRVRVCRAMLVKALGPAYARARARTLRTHAYHRRARAVAHVETRLCAKLAAEETRVRIYW